MRLAATRKRRNCDRLAPGCYNRGLFISFWCDAHDRHYAVTLADRRRLHTQHNRRARKLNVGALDFTNRAAGIVRLPLDKEKEQDVEDITPAPTQTKAKITGTASFRERLALGPGAVFVATLEDVSRADAKAEVLGEARIDPAGNPPYSFDIKYDPKKIIERHSYSVRATITLGDKLVFTTDKHYPFLTRGGNDQVELLLKRGQRH